MVFFYFPTDLCVSGCFSKPRENQSEGIWSHLVEQMWEMFFISRKILRVLLLSELFCWYFIFLWIELDLVLPSQWVLGNFFFLGGWGGSVCGLDFSLLPPFFLERLLYAGNRRRSNGSETKQTNIPCMMIVFSKGKTNP